MKSRTPKGPRLTTASAIKLWPSKSLAKTKTVATLANLESFYNSAEKAQGYRESREFFLDAARDFDRKWDVYVRPFTDEAEACANAAELYRLLVAKDGELRAKFKELIKTEGKGSKK